MVQVQTIETSTIIDNTVGLVGYCRVEMHEDKFVDANDAKHLIDLYKRYGAGVRGKYTTSVTVLDEPEFIIIESLEFDEHTTTHTERRFIITEF